MQCQRCQSERVAKAVAKCSDCCYVTLADKEIDGYVPDDIGIGGGDYVKIQWCLNCGQIQGNFPLEPCELEQVDATDDTD